MKPLNYAMTLNDLSSEVVHKYVGQEPSGRSFNELTLDYQSKFSFLIEKDFFKFFLTLKTNQMFKKALCICPVTLMWHSAGPPKAFSALRFRV